MPLYEYSCRACAQQFETLVRSDGAASCPGCGSTDLDRLLSVVSVGRTQEAPAPGACGTCGDPRGPGSCNS
ncbi:MAG TPA: zinc ribbon domain-containing protein [Candidatus Binatia bacterium]|nr:zinc ribbon domain-containing protein [Candidatus Binatia bacterium]